MKASISNEDILEVSYVCFTIGGVAGKILPHSHKKSLPPELLLPPLGLLGELGVLGLLGLFGLLGLLGLLPELLPPELLLPPPELQLRAWLQS